MATGYYVNRTTQIENSFVITEPSVVPGCLKSEPRDFPGGPVAKTLRSALGPSAGV